MAYDFRILVFMFCGVAAVIYGIFLMPPLTSGGGQGRSGGNQEEFESTVREELAYCQKLPNDINCQCFAQKSGRILSHKEPRVPGATYADKHKLARGQAKRAC